MAQLQDLDRDTKGVGIVASGRAEALIGPLPQQLFSMVRHPLFLPANVTGGGKAALIQVNLAR